MVADAPRIEHGAAGVPRVHPGHRAGGAQRRVRHRVPARPPAPGMGLPWPAPAVVDTVRLARRVLRARRRRPASGWALLAPLLGSRVAPDHRALHDARPPSTCCTRCSSGWATSGCTRWPSCRTPPATSPPVGAASAGWPIICRRARGLPVPRPARRGALRRHLAQPAAAGAVVLLGQRTAAADQADGDARRTGRPRGVRALAGGPGPRAAADRGAPTAVQPAVPDTGQGALGGAHRRGLPAAVGGLGAVGRPRRCAWGRSGPGPSRVWRSRRCRTSVPVRRCSQRIRRRTTRTARPARWPRLGRCGAPCSGAESSRWLRGARPSRLVDLVDGRCDEPLDRLRANGSSRLGRDGRFDAAATAGIGWRCWSTRSTGGSGSVRWPARRTGRGPARTAPAAGSSRWSGTADWPPPGTPGAAWIRCPWSTLLVGLGRDRAARPWSAARRVRRGDLDRAVLADDRRHPAGAESATPGRARSPAPAGGPASPPRPRWPDINCATPTYGIGPVPLNPAAGRLDPLRGGPARQDVAPA